VNLAGILRTLARCSETLASFLHAPPTEVMEPGPTNHPRHRHRTDADSHRSLDFLPVSRRRLVRVQPTDRSGVGSLGTRATSPCSMTLQRPLGPSGSSPFGLPSPFGSWPTGPKTSDDWLLSSVAVGGQEPPLADSRAGSVRQELSPANRSPARIPDDRSGTERLPPRWRRFGPLSLLAWVILVE
jgi:hypothetical protein